MNSAAQRDFPNTKIVKQENQYSNPFGSVQQAAPWRLQFTHIILNALEKPTKEAQYSAHSHTHSHTRTHRHRTEAWVCAHTHTRGTGFQCGCENSPLKIIIKRRWWWCCPSARLFLIRKGAPFWISEQPLPRNGKVSSQLGPVHACFLFMTFLC